MTEQNILILLLMSIGASFVQRVSGFGFGIFIMTVLPYLMPSYGEATTLSGLLASVTSLFISLKMRKHLSWKKLLPILCTFIVVSFFAVQFVAAAGDGTLKKILGCMLIFASIWFLFISKRIQLSPTIPVQVGMGTISGIMGGLFGMQGPPAVLYFVSTVKSKEEYMAIAQTYFIIGNMMMTLYRAKCGFLTESVGIAWCYGLAGVIIGTSLGAVVFKHVSLDVLRKIIYVYMAVSGFIALVC